jgi:hypothetical protein
LQQAFKRMLVGYERFDDNAELFRVAVGNRLDAAHLAIACT